MSGDQNLTSQSRVPTKCLMAPKGESSHLNDGHQYFKISAKMFALFSPRKLSVM